MECPQCSAAMNSRTQAFDDGETLEVWQCGACGYAEWSFQGDSWEIMGNGTPPDPLDSESEVSTPRGQRERARAGKN